MTHTYTMLIDRKYWHGTIRNILRLGYRVVHAHGLNNGDFELEVWVTD